MNCNRLQSRSGLFGFPPAKGREAAAWGWFYALGAISCVIYVAVMYYTPVAVIPIAGHDDGHFMQQGFQIARRHWLGGYSNMTLVKGPGLPIFLALSQFSRLPYSVSIALVEAVSFFLLSFCIGRLTRAPMLALLMLLIFVSFPWMSSGDSLRVLRDPLYTSVLFVFLALSFATIWGEGTLRKYYALAQGVALGIVSITREENPWLWPAAAFLIVAFFVGERRRRSGRATVVVLVLWTIIGLVGVRGAVMTVNYLKYRDFAVTDMGERNFGNALRALFSVEPSHRVPYLVVPQEVRSAIYEHSATFARLKALLDGDSPTLVAWQKPGCDLYGGKACGDYAGFWFVWAFRDAVELVGGYTNPKLAAAFYRQISQEVGQACEKKELTCRYTPIAGMPPFVPDDVYLMFGSAMKIVKLVTLLTPLPAERPRSQGAAETVRFYASFLNLPFTAPLLGDPTDAVASGTDQTRMIIFIQSVQDGIRNFYNAIWPLVCALGVLAILISTYVRFTRIGIDRFTIMMWTFVVLVVTRIALLSLLDATVFPAAIIDYANVAAYCLAAAIAMGIYSAVTAFSAIYPSRSARSRSA